MAFPTRTRRSLLIFGFVVASTAVVAAALSQARPDDSASLSAITSELRQLRATIEASMRAQSDTQVMAALLASHQSRITLLVSRLDVVRSELRDAAKKAREAAEMVTSISLSLSRETDAARMQEGMRMLAQDKAHAGDLAAVEQDLRTRESQLTQQLQQEEAMWADTVARLQQLIRR